MHTCSNSYKAVALTSELVAWNTSLVFLSQLRLMFPLDIHTLGMGHAVSNKKKTQGRKEHNRSYEFNQLRTNPDIVNQ